MAAPLCLQCLHSAAVNNGPRILSLDLLVKNIKFPLEDIYSLVDFL